MDQYVDHNRRCKHATRICKWLLTCIDSEYNAYKHGVPMCVFSIATIKYDELEFVRKKGGKELSTDHSCKAVLVAFTIHLSSGHHAGLGVFLPSFGTVYCKFTKYIQFVLMGY